ncbi:hypothetical protein TanjilG_13324 [Lupinus angustifolius]|uniref:Uncharacterized protein n=1 Tax=Lupinus angustifolius TaxID=3871 RepID=A0A4P1RUV1_LUPAN|nr:hypothetical protein TanjilG_13324 [Lupinus angustifolius]
MSGGTSIGVGGLIRQRHSPGGYGSSGDEVDLEDDACSRPRPFPPSTPAPPRRTWIELLGNFLWLASAAFILYFGDHHSNFIYILCHDNRIIRRWRPSSPQHCLDKNIGGGVRICSTAMYLELSFPIQLPWQYLGHNVSSG